MSNHIEIGNIRPRIRYIADGRTAEFSFPFPVFEAEDINIYLNDVLAVSGYTVENAGNSDGGKVIFNPLPAAGTIITILRNLQIKRTSDFQEGGAFRAKVINHELDYQTACIQQLEEKLDRTLTLAPYAPNHDMSLPMPESGKALIWKADGNGITNSAIKPDELNSVCESYRDEARSAAATSLKAAQGMEQLWQETAQKASEAGDYAHSAANYAALAENNFRGFLGSIMFAARTDVPANHLPADGQVWTREQFPDFYDHLAKGKEKTVTFEEWTALADANGGNVGCYGLDIANQKFRMISLATTLLQTTAQNDLNGNTSVLITGNEANAANTHITAYRAFVQVYNGVTDPSLLNAAELMSKFSECCGINADNLTLEGKNRIRAMGFPDYRTMVGIQFTVNTPIFAEDNICLTLVSVSGGSAINVNLCDSLGNLISPRSFLSVHTGANTLTHSATFIKKGEYFMVTKSIGSTYLYKTYLYGEN